MRLLFLIILFLGNFCTYGQTNISEIKDKKIQERVLLIKSRTDSLIQKLTSKKVFKKLFPDFRVTYRVGKFYHNYVFLNEHKFDPEDIYDLTQNYIINDTALGFSDTIRICYLELRYKFAPEINTLEVRFESNDDYLKVKALNHLYQPKTQQKFALLVSTKKLKAPYIHISVEGNSNTYFVFLKDKNLTHNYVL